jgi:hypothetical protein
MNRYDYQPTGALVLEIEAYVAMGGRKRWSDRAKSQLENLLGEFILRLEEVAEIEAEEAGKRERLRQVEAEERERAAAERHRREAEARRIAKLQQLASQWHAVGSIREFLAAMEARGPDHAELVQWGREVADKLDPLSDLEFVERQLAEGNRNQG